MTQTNVYMASSADLASARELMGRVGEAMSLPGSQGEPSFSRELPPIEGELLP